MVVEVRSCDASLRLLVAAWRWFLFCCLVNSVRRGALVAEDGPQMLGWHWVTRKQAQGARAKARARASYWYCSVPVQASR